MSDPAALAAHARTRRVGPGEILFREGDLERSVYVVASGSIEIRVAVTGKPERVLAVLGPGSIVGEVGLLLDEPRTATALAPAPAEVLEIDRTAFVDALDAGHDWARGLLLDTARALAERIGALDSALVDLIRRLPTENADELERLRSHLFTKWAY